MSPISLQIGSVDLIRNLWEVIQIGQEKGETKYLHFCFNLTRGSFFTPKKHQGIFKKE